MEQLLIELKPLESQIAKRTPDTVNFHIISQLFFLVFIKKFKWKKKFSKKLTICNNPRIFSDWRWALNANLN